MKIVAIDVQKPTRSTLHRIFELIDGGSVVFPINWRLPGAEQERLRAELDGRLVGPFATVVQTSGSSGRPKLAVHTLENHMFNAMGANENLPLGPSDRWILSLPLYHVGGLAILFRCRLAGAEIVIPEGTLEETDVDGAIVSCVPTQLKRLRGKPKAVLLGGGPVPHELRLSQRERCGEKRFLPAILTPRPAR
jgi:acyl-CoA synthetase (AMP-forming)/AMP-acid ligase II